MMLFDSILLLATVVPVYTLDFEDGLRDSRGNEPVYAKGVRFCEGVRGRGLFVDEKDGGLEYVVGKIVSTPTNGAFSCWFKMDEDAIGGMLQFDSACNEDRSEWTAQPNRSRNRRRLMSAICGNLDAGSYVNYDYADIGDGKNWVGTVKSNEWHHVLVQYRGDGCELFLDGVLFLHRMAWKGKVPSGEDTGRLRIGVVPTHRRDAWCSWGGAIDEVKLYDRALTPREVEVEYAQVRPYLLELMDHTATVGKETAIRFRRRDLPSGRLTQYTRTVKPDRPGVFRIRERDFYYDLMALDPEATHAPLADRQVFDASTLVADIDCTRDVPPAAFNHCGSSIVTNAAGCVYRESDLNLGVGFAYRVPLKNPGRAHWIELEYPDDAKREYALAVYPENRGVLYTITLDCFGIMTGMDNPTTGRLAKRRLLFFPDCPAVAVAVLGYRPFPGSKPPAAARIRVYEATYGAARSSAAPRREKAARRTFGIWDEDPTMDSHLGFAHFNGYGDMRASLEFYRHKWQNVLDYMAYEGLNAWIIKEVDYSGDAGHQYATFEHVSQFGSSPGRVPGWDDLGARMLDDAGHDIWLRMNWRLANGNWLAALGGDASLNVALEDRKGQSTGGWGALKFYHPVVRTALKRLLAGYRDRFSVYGHFRGVTLNEMCAPNFMGIENGYDAETVALFERETGVTVPATDAPGRYRFLVEGAKDVKEAWLGWRCAKTVEVARELAAELRAEGHEGLTLQFWVKPEIYANRHLDRWPDYDMTATLREAGIDLDALRNVEGLDPVLFVRPDYFRANGRVDMNEPYFMYSDTFAQTLNENGIRTMNVIRHCNFELYDPIIGTNYWKNAWWAPPTVGLRNDNMFLYYATPHPQDPYVLEPFAYLLAETDVQDFEHGFWGMPDVGVNDIYKPFVREYVKIPRGSFRLLDGFVNDPVAVRIGPKGRGWYAVNREGCRVNVTAKRRGFAGLLKGVFKLELGPCELKYFPQDFDLDPKSVRAEPDAAYVERILADVTGLRKAAAEFPASSLARDVMPRIETELAAKRWSKVRALLLTKAVRAERLRNKVELRPAFDPERLTLAVTVCNLEEEPLTGTLALAQKPQGGLRAKQDSLAVSVPAGGQRTYRFEYVPEDGKEVPANPGACHYWVSLATRKSTEKACWTFHRLDCTKRGETRSKPFAFYSTWASYGRSKELLAERYGKELCFRGNLEWDAKGVYVTLDVEDPDFIMSNSPHELYADSDSLQVYFDPRNDGRLFAPAEYDADDVVFQAGYLKGKPVVYYETPEKRICADATVSRTQVTKGWSHWEVFIPKTAVPGLRLEKGQVFGWNVQVNQRMRDALRGDYTVGLAGNGAPYRNPGKWFDAVCR